MTSDYLSPISKKLIDFKNKLPNDSLGNKIILYNIKKFDYNKIDIAIIGIKEYRNSVEVKSNFIDLDEFRKELYSLYYGMCTSIFEYPFYYNKEQNDWRFETNINPQSKYIIT